MTISTEALSNRTMSSFPISIGTSLCLESLGKGPNPYYDPEREIPNNIQITDYEEIWINLFTLFRNITSALEKDGFNRVMPHDLKDTLESEVEIIKAIIEQMSFGQTKAIFYASDYSNLNKHYPFASLRVDTTDRQKVFTSLLTNTINLYYKSQVKSDSLLHFNLKLKPKKASKAIIITNYAFDLLSHSEFTSLDLLESHTGILKNRSLWYTKFQNGKMLARIPFNEMFLQVFGDSQLFHPMDRKLREAVLEVSEKNNWASNTTRDRIKLGIDQIQNPYFKAVLKDLM